MELLVVSEEDGGTNKKEEQTGMIEAKTKQKRESTKQRLLKDKTFRRNIYIWLCLCWSFIVLGWVMGQLGPSLLDLQHITKSTLEGASIFVTATAIGALTGAIISGAIFDRINSFLLLFVSLTIMGFTVAAIPFCFIYEIMVFMHLLKVLGLVYLMQKKNTKTNTSKFTTQNKNSVDNVRVSWNQLASAGNSLLMQIFREEDYARSFLQTLHFTFAIGGILSPIATAHFLLPKIPPEGNSTHIGVFNASFVNQNKSLMYTEHKDNNTFSDYEQQSVLYQAYFISTIFCATAALPFLHMACVFKPKHDIDVNKNSVEPEVISMRLSLPLGMRTIVHSLMSVFIGTDNGLEDTYFGFFTTYTVKQFNWTKLKGSYATSVYWAAYGIGRFTAIFIAPHLKPSKLLRIYINLLIMAVLGLFLSTHFNFDLGVWIFSPMLGFAISVFFPSICLWTEEEFVPVSGRVASLLMVSASLGSMINPVVIGYLMDKFSPIWFMYISIGQVIALFTMTWIATLLSRFVKKYKIIEQD